MIVRDTTTSVALQMALRLGTEATNDNGEGGDDKGVLQMTSHPSPNGWPNKGMVRDQIKKDGRRAKFYYSVSYFILFHTYFILSASFYTRRGGYPDTYCPHYQKRGRFTRYPKGDKGWGDRPPRVV
ncbi:hypothetical protein CDAR_440171 [Caerostris darwini]|uniref:Uncharacterized protein n=1 Tax=Caerostris darwini TaxID=1538125 RepID=A0AAV4RMI4_9ARAC|nr:hypothetical protein CDAR_440171 [Caerostris darwini]